MEEGRVTADRLIINPLIHAEVPAACRQIGALDALLHGKGPQAFLAGKAFVACRCQGGAWSSSLVDFYIGAQAAVGC